MAGLVEQQMDPYSPRDWQSEEEPHPSLFQTPQAQKPLIRRGYSNARLRGKAVPIQTPFQTTTNNTGRLLKLPEDQSHHSPP